MVCLLSTVSCGKVKFTPDPTLPVIAKSTYKAECTFCFIYYRVGDQIKYKTLQGKFDTTMTSDQPIYEISAFTSAYYISNQRIKISASNKNGYWEELNDYGTITISSSSNPVHNSATN